MIINYLKIALRNIFKYKVFSIINISGLSLGLACTFVILFHVFDEFSYDKFHENSDSIYKLIKHSETNDKWEGRVSYPEGTALENKFADIKNVSVITRSFAPLIKLDGQYVRQNSCIYADTNFLKIFSVELIEGEKSNQLHDPFSVLISEKLATKYFQNNEAMGSTITIKDGENICELRINGIFKSLPNNSTLKVEMIIPILLMQSVSNENLHEKYPNFEVFILVPNQNAVTHLEAQLLEYRTLRYPNAKFIYHLIPLTDIRLFASHIDYNFETAKNINEIYVYNSIALLILLVACLNFVILTTARTSQKGKEIGIRKLVGASARNIKYQIIGETIFLTFISLPISFLFFELLLPLFNIVTGKELKFVLIENLIFIIIAIIICILISVISGHFISSRYSKMNTVDVIKNQIFAVKGKPLLRRIFIIVQLSIAVLLIVCSVIVIEQINYLGNKNLGFNKEQLLIFTYPIFDRSKLEIFKEELKANPNIINLATGTHMPPSNMTSKGQTTLPDNPDEKLSYEFVEVDYGYFETMGIKFIEGRNYSKEYSTDTAKSIIVNEEFVKKFNLQNKHSETFTWFNERRIIGIVEDFHIRGLYEKIPPAAFYLSQNMSWQIAVKINKANVQETISFIQNKWQQLNTDEVFSYNFVDEKFDMLYKGEQNFAKIIGSFSILAIFITCMGIFGLMLLTVEQRTKEIGMRKVLGASVSNIVNLLAKEYFIYILISIFIASPFAFYFMNKWLQNFAYKISVSVSELAISTVLIMFIILFTIGVQTIRAAIANPVNSLRNE